MKDFDDIKRICGFYVSSIHLITMILPYVTKELEQAAKFVNLLEFNLDENVNLVLSKLILNNEIKKEILNIDWYNCACNKTKIESKLKNILKDNEKLNIFISGSEKYINNVNDIVNKIINKNIIKNKKVKIINCYEVTQFNDNITEILETHDIILNSSGEHNIEEVFEGYKKKTS